MCDGNLLFMDGTVLKLNTVDGMLSLRLSLFSDAFDSALIGFASFGLHGIILNAPPTPSRKYYCHFFSILIKNRKLNSNDLPVGWNGSIPVGFFGLLNAYIEFCL